MFHGWCCPGAAGALHALPFHLRVRERLGNGHQQAAARCLLQGRHRLHRAAPALALQPLVQCHGRRVDGGQLLGSCTHAGWAGLGLPAAAAVWTGDAPATRSNKV
jgi:hypothetical protein